MIAHLLCASHRAKHSIILFNFGWRIVKEVQSACGWGQARWREHGIQVGGQKAWSGFWEDESGM